MTPATAAAISVVQPEGWVRLRMDDAIDLQISELSAAIARTADPSHRDLVRTRLRRVFRELADTAASHAYEVWMPVASTGGVTIPLTVTVGPLPRRPPAHRSAADSLLAIAAGSAGARAVSVGGRLAVRTVADIPGVKDDEGRYSLFPRRRVIVAVAPDDSTGAEWLAFVGEVIVPEVDDAADIVAASEFFFDALLTTVSFGDESIADAAIRARTADGRTALEQEET